MQYDSTIRKASCWICVFIDGDEQIDLYCFPTLGIAMQHYAHEIEGEWKSQDDGWHALLKLKSAFRPCYEIVLKSLLIEEGKDYEQVDSP